MRGWLATTVCGEDGRKYGLLQLSDKSGGADFTAEDEKRILELAALVVHPREAVEKRRVHRIAGDRVANHGGRLVSVRAQLEPCVTQIVIHPGLGRRQPAEPP